MAIIFDEYGYTNAETACASLNYRPSEGVNSLLKRLCNALTAKGVPHTFIYKLKSMDMRALKESGKYQIIQFRGDPAKQKPKETSYAVNKEGLIRLVQAIKIFNVKTKEADALLEEIGADVVAVTGEIAHLIEERKEQAYAASTVQEKKEIFDDSEVESTSDDDDETPLLLEKDIPAVASLEALLEDPCPVYSWRRAEVILSSTYSKFCNLATGRVNRQICRCVDRGDLKESLDLFILLDQRKVDAFCEMNDVHLANRESRSGLYLLTQSGVNNLSRYLNNEKAKAVVDAATSVATVVQDIERKGAKSVWLRPERILSIIQSLLDNHNALLDNNTKQLDVHERLVLAYEETTQTNKALVDSIRNLDTYMGWGRVSKDKIEDMITRSIDEGINNRIYLGEKEIPKHLIGNLERRATFFPAISSAVISKFLKSKNHPWEMWNKATEDDTTRIIPIKSYYRAGMAKQRDIFFEEISLVTRTDCYFKFNHPDAGGFDVLRKPTKGFFTTQGTIRRELGLFMELFCKFNPQYRYVDKTDDLILEYPT